MEKNGTTASATADEIDAMIAEGRTATNWARVETAGEDELARQIAADPDLAEPACGWEKAVKGLPFPLPEGTRQQVPIRRTRTRSRRHPPT